MPQTKFETSKEESGTYSNYISVLCVQQEKAISSSLGTNIISLTATQPLINKGLVNLPCCEKK